MKDMNEIKIDQKLKKLIKESVREVLSSEIMKLRASALLDVSDKEQKDIERRYSAPTSKKGKEIIEL